MAQYDFECNECEVYTTITCSMKDDEARGNVICSECEKKMSRVYSIPTTIIKKSLGDMKLTPTQNFVDIDGRPVKMNFIDHGDRSGLQDGSAASSIPGARIDEKTGRPVVDVVSNVRDPLGRLERGKKEGSTQVSKHKVNQKYKTK